VKDRQKQQFKEHVMNLNEDNLLSFSSQTLKTNKTYDIIEQTTNTCEYSRSTRRWMKPAPLSMPIVIAMPDVASHQRRLETSYTVQLGERRLLTCARM
jgi:hypothetical protein